MSNLPTAPKAKIVFYDPPACFHHDSKDFLAGHGKFLRHYQIEVTSITAEDEGWLAKGEGYTTDIMRSCPMCAMHYRAIMHSVPILCEPFNCPKCGQAENLDYLVKFIKADDVSFSFEFEVKIECSTCKKKRSLKKVIKEVLSVLKVEVSPSGITVKNA